MNPIFQGPLLEDFAVTVPGTGSEIVVSQFRSYAGITYRITTVRGSSGRDNLNDAFAELLRAHRWECRVRDHKAHDHIEQVVTLCRQCQ